MRFPKDHKVMMRSHEHGLPIIAPLKPERNGYCPCGILKKYKNCCMEYQIVNAENGNKFMIKKAK